MSYESYDELTVNEAKELLRKWRDTNERRSEDVLDIWYNIFDKTDKLGHEAYVVMEQVTMAALDCHNYMVANDCIATLSSLFPGSLRVLRLKACRLEADEKYDEALKLLKFIIKSDVTNAPARKRIVAIHKARGNIIEAIKENNTYLQTFMLDIEMWGMQCEMLLSIGDYARAVFCAEELLLHQPHNHLHHQRVADIRYTMGGLENYELAKSYYCHALKLNPDNMRALFGLVLVTNHLLSQCKGAGARRKELWRANRRAAAAATQRQKASNPDITEMMLSLAVDE